MKEASSFNKLPFLKKEVIL